ncbi:MAG: polymer-forming cytoskeletal protein [Candidatus Aminicenantes bacterium]|nr:polymer-forming cytoskeletal protein [Candidatus Aminicenantes bacterium]
MNRSRGVLILFLTFLALAPAGRAAQQNVTMEKDVFVAAGETQDNVFSLGGDIVVDGRVKESVIAIGGSITVSGEVGQAVVGVGSRILIKASAKIEGDVVSLGGSLEKEPGCTIRGDTVYFRASELTEKLFGKGLPGNLFSLAFVPVVLVFKLIGVFLWLLAGLVMAALFPRQLALASGEVRRSFWPVFGTGFLAVVIFTALVIFAALLSLILIGIPILIILILAGLVFKIFGRVIMFYLFGESILRAFNAKRIAALGAVLLGLLVVSIVDFIPLLGLLFTLVINIIGWGVTIRTKFGTTENMFRRGGAEVVKS